MHLMGGAGLSELCGNVGGGGEGEGEEGKGVAFEGKGVCAYIPTKQQRPQIAPDI